MNTLPPKPKVSVCIVTYNHEKFIAQAIESVLMQQVDFNYELVIGEDCSIDDTRCIVAEYQRRHPDKIRALFNAKNMGAAANGLQVFQACRGKYVALLDGDDYWTTPHKLQKQVDFLDANPQLVGCFHDAKIVDSNMNVIRESFYHAKKSVYTQKDCLGELESIYATCTLMYRNIITIPPRLLSIMDDFLVDLLITEHGDLGYMPENMACYRVHAGGVWQGKTRLQNCKTLLNRYEVLLKDETFGVRYKDILIAKKHNMQLEIGEAYKYRSATCEWRDWIQNCLQMLKYHPQNRVIKAYLLLRHSLLARLKYKTINYFKKSKESPV